MFFLSLAEVPIGILQKYVTAELRKKGMYGSHDGQEEGVVYS